MRVVFCLFCLVGITYAGWLIWVYFPGRPLHWGVLAGAVTALYCVLFPRRRREEDRPVYQVSDSAEEAEEAYYRDRLPKDFSFLGILVLIGGLGVWNLFGERWWIGASLLGSVALAAGFWLCLELKFHGKPRIARPPDWRKQHR